MTARDDLDLWTHDQLVSYVMNMWQHYAAQLWCAHCHNKRQLLTCHLEDPVDGLGGLKSCPMCRPWKSPSWLLANHIHWHYMGGEEEYERKHSRCSPLA